MKQVFIEENDFQKARKKIKENKNEKIIFHSNSDEINRKILEKEKISVLLLKLSGRKDSSKQRNSGFNQVLAKSSKKNEVSIGIFLDEILNLNPKEKAKILARLRQNIKLCGKNKIKMVFVSSEKRDKYDLKSLGALLGMPTEMSSKIELILHKTKPF